jgi:transposase-like protein/IS1 family transposase
MNLVQIQTKFNTQAKCLKYLEKLRWGKTVKCSYCDSDKTIKSKSEQGRHYCYDCKRSFTVFVGTIFEGTRLPLPLWFLTIGLILNSKGGVSAQQIKRQVGITLKTAWLTAMKIRCAMISKNTQLNGVLEMDESYFGNSKTRITKETKDNTPILASVADKRGRGTKKVPVVGIVERGGDVKTKIIEKLTARNLKAMLNHYVKTDESVLVTDGFKSYAKMDEEIEHITVKHSERSRKLNTNTIEGYWSLIKNSIKGNYRSLSMKYLPFYLVQYDYMYNHRKDINIFDDFIKDALTNENNMINYKPNKEVKKIVYG